MFVDLAHCRGQGRLRHARWPRTQHRPSDAGIPGISPCAIWFGASCANAPELLADIDLQDRALDAHGHNFAGWLTVNGTVQRRVRDYLKASTAAFEAEI